VAIGRIYREAVIDYSPGALALGSARANRRPKASPTRYAGAIRRGQAASRQRHRRPRVSDSELPTVNGKL
jgi:hypothetical protein